MIFDLKIRYFKIIKIFLLTFICLNFLIFIPNYSFAKGESSAEKLNKAKDSAGFLIRKEKNLSMINKLLAKYQKKLGCLSSASNIKALKSCRYIRIKKDANLSVNKEMNINNLNKTIKRLQENISCVSSAQDEKKVTICRKKKGKTNE